MRFGPITGLLATAMAAVLLAACGGGGGKDTTPDAFDFGVLDNAAPGIFHLSQAITVSGVSAGVDIPITIEGEGCAYSTGDGFSTETGNVRNGDIVRVLLKAPAAPETEAACTVDIGGITGSFTLTTGTNAFAMNVIPGHLVFTWAGFNGVGNYQLLRVNNASGETEMVANILGNVNSYKLGIPVHLTDWHNDRFRLVACNAPGCNTVPEHEAALEQPLSIGAIHYLKASDAATSGYFGYSVALDGDRLAVGAPGAREGRGAVYIFRRENGEWKQEAFLESDSSQVGTSFGGKLALKGDLLAIGAPLENVTMAGNQTAERAGAVHIYRYQQEWQKIDHLTGNEAGAQFGSAIAIHGDIIAIGAPYEDGDEASQPGNNNLQDSGAVYVYRYASETETWQPEAFIERSQPAQDELFGYALAASEGLVVIGAPLVDAATGSGAVQNSGAVFVFRYEDGEWREAQLLAAETPQANAYFGTSLALDGGLLAVGAPRDVGTDAYEGAVYVYALGEDGFEPGLRLAPPLPKSNYDFGMQVALSGHRLAVSAPYEASNATGVGGDMDNEDATDAGAVHVFELRDNEWRHVSYVKAGNTGAGDYFGDTALAMDGETLAVGAWGEDGENDALQYSGAIYVY